MTSWSKVVSDALAKPSQAEPAEPRLVRGTPLNTGPNSWFTTVVTPGADTDPSQERKEAIALDPGTRSFVTGFASDGTIVEWGKGDDEIIKRTLNELADVRKRMARRDGKRKENLEIMHHRIERHMHNRVNHMHHLLAFYLLCHFKLIILPNFGENDPDEKDTVTRVYDHKAFRRLLVRKAKSARFKHKCTVRHGSEAKTTRTCTICGFYNGANIYKHLTCANCHTRLGRDVNAARNIMIRYMIDNAQARMDKPLVP